MNTDFDVDLEARAATRVDHGSHAAGRGLILIFQF
jgi:hypothetical protein